MTDVEDYLRRAEHAVSLMERASDPEARSVFEREARAWLRLADDRMQRPHSERAAGDVSAKVLRFPTDQA